MFQPRGFADLTDRRVGLYGMGVEGRASLNRLTSVTTNVVLVDDHPTSDDVVATNDGGLEALATCDVVLKSPGIPIRSATVTWLRDRGVTVTSALALWMHDAPRSRTIGVTGTKGKSTTTSLISFFFACMGETAHALGNIGQPPYDTSLDLRQGWLVVELSSFQCVGLDVAPERIVITSLGSDHLDWHGSLEQYRDDKLAITRCAGPHVTFCADALELRTESARMGGDVRFIERHDEDLATALNLLGHHSHSNVALALAVVADALGVDATTVAARVRTHANEFVPLRGRLTPLATIGGIDYIDDGLATSSLPTIAALDVFGEQPLALIVGGFDRGVDYGDLAHALVTRTGPTSVVALGPAGARIADLLDGTAVPVARVSGMADAVEVASASLSRGVVLFSPAAPSFDAYRNWLERSQDFARHVAARGE